MAGLQWTGCLDPFGIEGLSSGDEGRGGDGPGSESSGLAILDPATNERADSSPLFSGAASPTSPRYTPSTGSSVAGLIEHAQSDDGAEPSDGRHDRNVHAPSGG
jgi:hypothetical protein